MQTVNEPAGFVAMVGTEIVDFASREQYDARQRDYIKLRAAIRREEEVAGESLRPVAS